jgi:uncharacterized protein
MEYKMRRISVFTVFFIATFFLSANSKNTVMMPMSDGTELETDIYFPDNYENSSFPVILNRSPYDRSQKNEIGTNLASNGIVFIAQSLRGTFGSEGDHGIFHTEGWGETKDGYDSLKWITEQGWCNGKIATFGGSAEGLVQYFMAGLDEKPGLVYQIIYVASGDLYNGTFFPDGVFREHAISTWLSDQQVSYFVDNLQEGDMYSKSNSYWDTTDVFQREEKLDVPASHIAGWFDMFGKHQIDTFRFYQQSGAIDQNLVIGPWDHAALLTNKAGDLVFPENAAKYYEGDNDPSFGMLVHYFWPQHSEKPDWAPVTYYTIGDVFNPDSPGNEWRESEMFPPEDSMPLILSSGSDLILKHGDCGEGEFVLDFDYANPFPSICGNNLTIKPGPCDVSGYRKRSDVLSFSTEPFVEPTEITGAIDLSVRFKTDVEDFDMAVILTDIYPDGKEYLMLEGTGKARFKEGLRKEVFIEKGEWTEMKYSPGYISIILDKGHKLGIHIATAYYPKYRIPSTVKDYWNNEPVKGSVTFDLSKTKIIIDTVGNWGGEVCEDIEDQEESDDSEKMPEELADSDVEIKSKGCSTTVL